MTAHRRQNSDDSGELLRGINIILITTRRRLVGLLGYELSSLAPSLALSLLHNKAVATRPSLLTADQLGVLLTPYDVKVFPYLFFSFPLASSFRRHLPYVL